MRMVFFNSPPHFQMPYSVLSQYTAEHTSIYPPIQARTQHHITRPPRPA